MDVRKNIATLAISSVLGSAALATVSVGWLTWDHSVRTRASEVSDLEQRIQAANKLATAEMAIAVQLLAYRNPTPAAANDGPLLVAAGADAGCTWPGGTGLQATAALRYNPTTNIHQDCLRGNTPNALPAWAPELAARVLARAPGEPLVGYLTTPDGLLQTAGLATDGGGAVYLLARPADQSLADHLGERTGTALRLAPFRTNDGAWPDELVSRIGSNGSMESAIRLFDRDDQPVAELWATSPHRPPLPVGWVVLPLVVSAGLAAALSFVLARRLAAELHTDPLAGFTLHVKRAKTAPGTRIQPPPDRELQALGVAINDLLDNQEQAEAAAREAQEATNAERQGRRALLETTSHEVRTATSSVVAALDMMARSPLDPATQRQLEIARGAAAGVLDLSKHLNDLDPERTGPQGRVEIRTSPLDLVNLLEETLSPLRARAEARGLRLLTPEPTNLPARLNGDAGRIRRMLDSLLGHRIDQAEPGTLSFTASWREPCFLQVNLEEAPSSNTNNRPVQGPPPRDSRLLMTRRLVDAMRGSIREEQRREGGCSIQIELPLTRVPEAHPSGAGAEPIPRAEGTTCILLVDDNHVNLMVAEKTLRAAGYDVVRATSGHEALNLQGTVPVDLVLMDIAMPGMDGVQTCVLWREREKGPRVPILALSAMVSVQDIARCRTAGMDDFVPKPFRTNDLINAIVSALTRSAAHSVR